MPLWIVATLAKLASLKASVGRWATGDTVKAISLAIVAVCLLGGVVYLTRHAETGATAKRDVTWIGRLAAAKAAHDAERARTRDAVSAAVTAERAIAKRDVAAEAEKTASYQRKLDEITEQSGDPVVFPRALVQEINR
jgi:hypothetical protein